MIYEAKLKTRKEMERTIQRGLLGWWYDVCPGQTLEVREATAEDLARCSLRDRDSADPADYLCENIERGSLIHRHAVAILTPWDEARLERAVRLAIQRFGAERFARALAEPRVAGVALPPAVPALDAMFAKSIKDRDDAAGVDVPRAPLTDEQIKTLAEQHLSYVFTSESKEVLAFARGLLAASGVEEADRG